MLSNERHRLREHNQVAAEKAAFFVAQRRGNHGAHRLEKARANADEERILRRRSKQDCLECMCQKVWQGTMYSDGTRCKKEKDEKKVKEG